MAAAVVTAAMTEVKTQMMNLSALQQGDPYITDILNTATKVALYKFSQLTNSWSVTGIEGSLFVYTR